MADATPTLGAPSAITLDPESPELLTIIADLNALGGAEWAANEASAAPQPAAQSAKRKRALDPMFAEDAEILDTAKQRGVAPEQVEEEIRAARARAEQSDGFGAALRSSFSEVLQAALEPPKAAAAGPPPGMDLSAPEPAYEYRDWPEADKALTDRFALLGDARGNSVWDSYNAEELSVAKFDALFRRHMPKPAKGARPTPFTVLVESEKRKDLAGTMYWPGAPSLYKYQGRLWGNLYKGAPHDEVPMTFTAAKHFVRLLRHLFPSGRLGQRPWLRHYITALAYLYQVPGSRLEVAMILTGEQMGSGKTLLMYDLPKAVFGNTTKVNAREIFTSFNSWVGKTRILFMDELQIDLRNPHERQFEFELRDMVTGSVLRVVGKGKDGRTVLNCVTIFAASNNTSDLLPMNQTDRRYAVEETTASSMLSEATGKAVGDLLQEETPTRPAGPGGAMLRWYLRRKSIKDFNPRAIPETAARAAIKRASVPVEQEIIEDAMERGSLARGFGTLAEVEQAVLETGHRPMSGKLHREKWAKLLIGAAKARGLLLTPAVRIEKLPARPVYRLWARDIEGLREARTRLNTVIDAVLRTTPVAARQRLQTSTTPGEGAEKDDHE